MIASQQSANSPLDEVEHEGACLLPRPPHPGLRVSSSFLSFPIAAGIWYPTSVVGCAIDSESGPDRRAKSLSSASLPSDSMQLLFDDVDPTKVTNCHRHSSLPSDTNTGLAIPRNRREPLGRPLRIFADVMLRQMNRVRQVLDTQLVQFRAAEEGARADFEEAIARIIWLVGEPAWRVASEMLEGASEDDDAFEAILGAVSRIKDDAVAKERRSLIWRYHRADNAARRYIAATALSRDSSPDAKKEILRVVSW